MKKYMALLLGGTIVLTMAACQTGGKGETKESAVPAAADSSVKTPAAEEPVELTVFAAASLTETLNEIAGLYKEVAPNVSIVYTFDSSGSAGNTDCRRGRL